MNLFVADPHWGWWIILYFFLGGIAAGAYFMATLLDLVGREADQDLVRLGYLIALPLIAVCGVFLVVDLDRPERFWHMLFKSAAVHEAWQGGWPWTGRSWAQLTQAPLLKYWSPMSVGSWALALFGLCSALSLVGSLGRERRWAYWLRRGLVGRSLQAVGCLVGFFVAAYTGALLTATNQPLWSDSIWIAPLFLTSAASTGLATLILLAYRYGMGSADALHRLERADHWVLWLELAVFAVFLAGLGSLLVLVLRTWQGQLLVVGTGVLGLIVPLGMYALTPAAGIRRAVPPGQRARAVALFSLLGGFALRYALVAAPPELLARGPVPDLGSTPETAATPAGLGILPRFSPEDGRTPGSLGADPGNTPTSFQPRSKVFLEP
jgi:formate-dependent nitrite reductase membrane component NrfD